MTPRLRSILVGALLAVTAAGTSLQARLNATLLEDLGNATEVSLVNLAGALIVISLVVLARADLRQAWVRTFRGVRDGALRWWEIAGGLGGAYFVAVQSVGAKVVGVAVFTVAVVAGQTWSAMVIDRVGLGPAGRVPVTWRRVAAAFIAIIAVLLPAVERISAPAVGAAAALVIALAVTAGISSSMQGALNGRVGAFTGQPLIGAWGNFALGTLVLCVVVGVSVALTPAEWSALPWDQPWLLIAGTFGLAYVATATWAVRSMGVLLTALISIVGLLAGALAVDIISPTGGADVGLALLGGVLLSAASVALATWQRRRASPSTPERLPTG